MNKRWNGEFKTLKHVSVFAILNVTWFTVHDVWCVMKVWFIHRIGLWTCFGESWDEFISWISNDQLNIYKDFIHIASLLESKSARKKLKIQGRDFFKILMKGTTIQKIFPFFLYKISIFINETLIPLLFIF